MNQIERMYEYQPIGDMMHYLPYLLNFDGRRLVGNKKGDGFLRGTSSIYIRFQTQIAQFHVNEVIFVIFPESMNINDIGVDSLAADLLNCLYFVSQNLLRDSPT
jgi:hypothetical protein